MNKTKRAARNRKRQNESLNIARIMDRKHIALYDSYERVRIHNVLASRGVGMVVDEVWVREYYERRTILF
tara:strand:+ start:71 stop:280 length:210 start_codon:yes stop_codon:yes gene_type:complete